MNWFRKFLNWFKTSDRYVHFTGGMLIGLGANDLYCAAYAGIWVKQKKLKIR